MGPAAGPIMIGMMVAGGLTQAYAQYQSGRVAAEVGERQAQLMKEAAERERRAGQIESAETQMQGRQAEGAARAAYAGAGVELESGTPLETVSDIRWRSSTLAKQQLNDAYARGWQMDVQADLERWEGKQRRRAGQIGAIGSLLTTGSAATGQYGQIKGWW